MPDGGGGTTEKGSFSREPEDIHHPSPLSGNDDSQVSYYLCSPRCSMQHSGRTGQLGQGTQNSAERIGTAHGVVPAARC